MLADHSPYRPASGNSGALAERARHLARNFPRVGNRSSIKAALLSKKNSGTRTPVFGDVVDCGDHRPGKSTSHPSEPNLAVGGLPLHCSRKTKRGALSMRSRCFCLRHGSTLARARRAELCTDYQGGSRERDAIYHQAPVWPWPHWSIRRGVVRVRGSTSRSKSRSARQISPANLSTSERGWSRSHLRNLRRRTAAHPTRCPFQACR